MRLLWQLYPSYLLITLVSLLVATLYASGALRDFFYDRTAADLRSRAWLLEEEFGDQLVAGRSEHIDELCKWLGETSSTRITVILPTGKVVGDSDESPANMENHAHRPEVMDALAGGSGAFVRFSHTVSQDMMYVAIPVRRGGQTVGILRTSIPVTSIDRRLRAIQLRIAAGGLVVALLAAVVSLLVSRRISRPLEQLKRGAEQFARGDLAHKLPAGNALEIAALAETMNQMAAELDKRLRTVVRQRNEREAVLSSMVEGVLAVDSQQRLISLNQAAARLLGVKAELARGRSLQEAIRNPQLQNLVAEVFAKGGPSEGEIPLYGTEERYLHANGTILRDTDTAGAEGPGVGALVVLHDVTELRRLDSIRRDFVANVSHELRTPVTSIKGFVETLLDGAMHDPDNAERFLRILASQSDRLNAIIEDLLTLSRIEEESQKTEIMLAPGRIKAVLQAAVAVCQPKIAEKAIQVELRCDESLQAGIDAPLLEQAVVNLIDNAVKYSPQRGIIHLQAARGEEEIVIRVQDHGCGIEGKHLPRLFERFYRVDKARSRTLGGTGLGLAIVKHIMQLHGGRATVESSLGAGSTFSLHLPA
jgi:two-component system phosphate regulon sensor histidine kinase PhoR